jgi:N-acetylglutamate synthase-like GNAT family acetyltransferase
MKFIENFNGRILAFNRGLWEKASSWIMVPQKFLILDRKEVIRVCIGLHQQWGQLCVV